MGKKNAIHKDGGVGRVFMGAGARNRRYLHLNFMSLQTV